MPANSHTFTITPWVPAAHDVDLHKRRASVYIRNGGMGLARGSSEGMSGPVVVTKLDGSAEVTYTLATP